MKQDNFIFKIIIKNTLHSNTIGKTNTNKHQLSAHLCFLRTHTAKTINQQLNIRIGKVK